MLQYEGYTMYKAESGVDSMIELKFYFEDGDGNIGLTEDDSLPPFNYGSPTYHNLPVKYLVKDSTGFNELINPINNLPYGNRHDRVPPLNLSSKDRAISGNLSVFVPANPLNTKPLEVKFEAKLYDKSLNESQTVVSDVISIQH